MPYRLDIPGQVSVFQLRAIEAIASLVPPHGVVVEVGSLFGRSSWAWGASVPPSTEVFCIDPWEHNAGVRAMEQRYGIKYGLEQFIEYTKDQPNITPKKGYSPNDFLDWNRNIDLYYEDAVHTNPILARNLEFWSSKLKPTGVLCGDDYRPRFPDVRSGAEGLAKAFGRELILVENFWCLLPEESVVPGAQSVAETLRAIAAEAEAEKRKQGFVLSIGPKVSFPKVEAGQDAVVEVRVSNESLDPWPAPSQVGKPIEAILLIVANDPVPRIVARVVAPIGFKVLEPDMPIDFSVQLPITRLVAGRYRAVFDLLAPDGSLASGRKAEAASGVVFDVPESRHTAASTSRQIPLPKATTPNRTPLFDRDLIRQDFTSAVFSDSHGAFDGFLGAGSLYYALTHAIRAQVAVCIGSGGGFVPSLLRRAQLDAAIEPSCTFLVDANLPDLAFGSPVQAGGWLTEESAFLKRESDIVVLRMLSADAAPLLAAQGLTIDYLHIDGDHSLTGVLADFRDFSPLLSPYGVITLHDLRMPSVEQALTHIRKKHPEWEALTFPEIGAGTIVLRRRVSTDVPRRPQNRADFVDPQRRVTLDEVTTGEAVAASQIKAKFERWEYLTSPSFKLRYDIVARLLDTPDATIVEVGGFPNSVVNSFVQARRIHAIEPYAPQDFIDALARQSEKSGTKLYLHRGSLGAVNLPWNDIKPYRFVALGLDLTSGSDSEASVKSALHDLISAVGSAELAAIEIPRYAPSLATFEVIEELLVDRKLTDITIDLTKDPSGDDFHVKDARAVRRLVVFHPKRDLSVKSPLVLARLESAAQAIYALKTKETQPTQASYTIGELVSFVQGGNSETYKRRGWVGAEKRHTWTNGPTSSLVLDIERPAEGVDTAERFLLQIEASPFVVKGKLDKQTWTVSVNGHEVHSQAHSEAMQLEIEIPASILFADKPTRINFSQPECRRPSDLIDGSRDQKLLGFAVRELRILLGKQ
jgi:hypothetical protein